jgi:Ankyrin repeat
MGDAYQALHSFASLGDLISFRANHLKNLTLSEQLFIIHSKVDKPQHYSIDIKNKYGMSSLHCAAYYGHLNILLYILLQGGDVNMYSSFGHSVHQSIHPDANRKTEPEKKWATALHLAAANGHRTAAVLLLDHGALPLLLDYKGYTASQIANMQGHKKAAEIIDFYSSKMPKSTSSRREIIGRIHSCKQSIEHLRHTISVQPQFDEASRQPYKISFEGEPSVPDLALQSSSISLVEK